MEEAMDLLPYFDVHPSVMDRDAPKFPLPKISSEMGQFQAKISDPNKCFIKGVAHP